MMPSKGADLLGRPNLQAPERWEVEDLLALPTRNEPYDLRPDLLGEVPRRLSSGDLTPRVAAAVVPRLWLRLAPIPVDLLPVGKWRHLFALAGYTVDGEPAPRPDGPTLLYRGGSPAAWSWTDDARLAWAFAMGFGVRTTEGRLWTTLAPPEALCARVPAAVDQATGATHLHEFVVDPSRLGEVRLCTPEEYDAAAVQTWTTRDGLLQFAL